MSAVELETEAPSVDATAARGRTPWQLAWERLRRDKVAIGSVVVLAIVVVAALAAPLVADWIGHAPNQQFRDTGITPSGLPVAPNAEFWFGTDHLGRDLFVRVLYGARISLLVGVVATLLATIIGVIAGMVSGYFGGVVDTALGRTMDIVLSLPYLLLALVLATVFGPSLAVTLGIIAFFSWAAIARVVRGQTLALKEREYVEAARSLGAGDLRIMFVDILPNLLAPVIVLATLLVPLTIVIESTLSFLGVGIVPPQASWGTLLQESIEFYRVAWWFMFFPGAAILLTTLSFNLLGDGIRDALDPRAERLLAGRTRRRRTPPAEDEEPTGAAEEVST
ncbi:MAG TPA: ABC transporter permease [Actinopolymorphaceae bacterium]